MHRRRYVLLALALPILFVSSLRGDESKGKPARVVRKFGWKEPEPFNTHRFLFSPEVVADADGTLRLAHSSLVADEMGATDHFHAEPLSDRVWAMKVFRLPKDAVRDAELFFFGDAKEVRVNDHPLAKIEPLVSTGWKRAKVPSEFLGMNFDPVVFRGGGQLVFEPTRRPGDSHRSTDQGAWWSRSLGPKGGETGEYLVRLRLKSYAPRGYAMGMATSPVFDLWAGKGVAVPGRVVSIAKMVKLTEGHPKDTMVRPYLRTGSTPTPDETHWTPWELMALVKDHEPPEEATRHRWAQLRFEIDGLPQATARLPGEFEFAYDFQPDAVPVDDKLEVITPEKRSSLTSVPFVYQEPSPRLKLLRERYQLDKVIAPGKTEMEQLMLLRYWVRNQWHTAWGSHAAPWMPPWDALVILECMDQPDCLTMCTHYAAVFTQCCLALGWNARHCILDHHCVSEVFDNQHAKWVMMDAGNSAQRADVGLHFELCGVPLSALELHQAQRTGKTDGIIVRFTPARLIETVAPLCRPAPPSKEKVPPRPDVIPVTELSKYPVCGLENYRRYAFPGRNDLLTSLVPGEPHQGWSEYFYDGYWWVGDSPDDPKTSPEYSRHLDPARPQDIDWFLNWTRIHLARTAKPGELRVDLETLTPNLARLERLSGKDTWKPTPNTFTWKLERGNNELRVRSVNQFERPGVESAITVKWAPASR
jgi:hypothetical protein